VGGLRRRRSSPELISYFGVRVLSAGGTLIVFEGIGSRSPIPGTLLTPLSALGGTAAANGHGRRFAWQIQSSKIAARVATTWHLCASRSVRPPALSRRSGGPAIGPHAGAGRAAKTRPCRSPANYHKRHGVRQFHGCYSVGDDTMWGVAPPQVRGQHPRRAQATARHAAVTLALRLGLRFTAAPAGAGGTALHRPVVAAAAAADELFALRQMGFDVRPVSTATLDAGFDPSTVDVLYVSAGLRYTQLTPPARAAIDAFLTRGAVVTRGTTGARFNAEAALLPVTAVAGRADGNGIVAVESSPGPVAGGAPPSALIFSPLWFTGIGAGVSVEQRYAGGNPLLAGHWLASPDGTGGPRAPVPRLPEGPLRPGGTRHPLVNDPLTPAPGHHPAKGRSAGSRDRSFGVTSAWATEPGRSSCGSVRPSADSTRSQIPRAGRPRVPPGGARRPNPPRVRQAPTARCGVRSATDTEGCDRPRLSMPAMNRPLWGARVYIRSGAVMPSRLSPVDRTCAVRSHRASRLPRAGSSALRTGQRS
jgi:hypothetical protein